jgi:5-amino-6-(5-phospho-D-ribitylamino)uracil phosphatase
MIALDLDGTLAIANNQVSPATRDALHELHEGGVEVVIATGRRYRSTRYVIENLGIDTFAVCNGGALVKTPDQKTLHRDTYDISPIVEVARSLGLALFAQRDAHDHGGVDFVIDSGVPWSDVIKQYYENNREWSAPVDLLDAEPEFLVSGVFGSEAELWELANVVERSHGNRYNAVVVPHPRPKADYSYCEIAQGHVDKWHGLTRLKEHLDIKAEHVCAVGDELNDIPMIRAAGHGFAMQNGHEELQATARFVCGHNEEDGIVEVVNYIQEVNERAR